jgi:hypothetical protein
MHERDGREPAEVAVYVLGDAQRVQARPG